MYQFNFFVFTIILAVISFTTAVSQPFWNNNGGSSFDGAIQRGGPFGGVLPNNQRSDYNDFGGIQNGGIQNSIPDVNGLSGDRFSEVSTDQLNGAANGNLFGGFKSGDIFNSAPSGDFSSGISNGADFVSSGLSPNDYFGGIPNGNTLSGPLDVETPASNFLAEIPNGIPRNDAILGGNPLSGTPSGGIPNGNHAVGIPNTNFLRPRIGIPVGPLPNRNPLSSILANNYLDDIPTGIPEGGNQFGGPQNGGFPGGDQLARIPATDFLRGDPRVGIPAAQYLDDIPTGANPSRNPFGGPQNGGFPGGDQLARIPPTDFLRGIPSRGIPSRGIPSRGIQDRGIPGIYYLDDIPSRDFSEPLREIPRSDLRAGPSGNPLRSLLNRGIPNRGIQNRRIPGIYYLDDIPSRDFSAVVDPLRGIPRSSLLRASPSGNPFGGAPSGSIPSRGIPDGNPLRDGNIGGDRFGGGGIPARDDLLDNISRDELLASIFADDILENILDSDIMSGIENSNQFSGGIRNNNLGRIAPSGFFGGARRR
ncbi:collagen alpha-1(IV) chain-like [Episyrphus balteatus]|uniref:collagen alpha-1(IV) chain-like n=1 Tax=Episyrphus balteatus TaxID=286459 RepID=UPI00248669CD|nr:collagen alpha-1(IV) chain-like [Episyrphus balteatus]